MLVQLANAGMLCFIYLNFVGAPAYADDIALLAPTLSAMRKLYFQFAMHMLQSRLPIILLSMPYSPDLVVAASKRQ